MGGGMEADANDWLSLLEMTPAHLRPDLERKVRTVRASKGRTIYSVRAQATDVFFVAEGEVQVLLYSVAGREVAINRLGPGGSFGQLAAIDGLPRSASIVAATDVRLRVIDRRDFLSVLEASPQAALWVARRLCADVRRLSERVFELSALNVQARLHCELWRLARGARTKAYTIHPAPTHAELASRIGANREAVSREMGALAKMNIVRQQGRSLEFLDLEELGRVVWKAVGTTDEGLAEAPS